MFHRLRSMSLVLLAMLGGCPAESDLPAVREPRCEPRSTTAPGRLNLHTRAEQYGTIPPCRLEISLAIAGNTNLRALRIQLLLEGSGGEAILDKTQWVELGGPRAGMWRAETYARPGTGPSCRALALEARIVQCLDAKRRDVTCPQVRVRESLVLRSLEVRGAEVCFDQ